MQLAENSTSRSTNALQMLELDLLLLWTVLLHPGTHKFQPNLIFGPFFEVRNC